MLTNIITFFGKADTLIPLGMSHGLAPGKPPEAVQPGE